MAWANTRAKLAVTIRDHPDADTTELRRQLKEERIEARVAKIISEASPLTDRQRLRLASIILDGAGDHETG